jgi:hypothetical protein
MGRPPLRSRSSGQEAVTTGSRQLRTFVAEAGVMAARASYIAPLRHRMLVAREAKLGKVLGQLSLRASA